jgi:hypothetical protein
VGLVFLIANMVRDLAEREAQTTISP